MEINSNVIKSNHSFLIVISKESYKNRILNKIVLIINLLLMIIIFHFIKNINLQLKKKKENIINLKNDNKTIVYKNIYENFKKDLASPRLKEISQKMSFEQRLPLPKIYHFLELFPHLYFNNLAKCGNITWPK